MGTRRTKRPAIPAPTPHNTLQVLEAIKEHIEVNTQTRGDPLDGYVSYRDLVEGGIANYYDASTVNAGGVGSQIINKFYQPPIFGGPPGPGSGFLWPVDPNLVRPLPSAPTNVRTVALWDSIMVKWDWPVEQNVDWKRAAIWASPDEKFPNGAIVGYSTSNFFVHEGVGLATFGSTGVRYYWVRWEGNADADGNVRFSDWGPSSNLPGVSGKSSVDPAYTLSILTDQITESQIYESLNTRINLIDFDENGNQYFEPVQSRILAATQETEDGIYSAIAEYAGTSIDGNVVRGEYNIRLDLNGYIVGFGLSALAKINSATGNPYGETSAFVIKADTFAVVMPGKDEIIPFIVGDVNGVPTVGINGELVVDGTIVAQAIEAGAIGAREINAVEITASVMQTEMLMANVMRTGPYPQTRVEINGNGSQGEVFPIWFGWGETSPYNSEASSPVFYFQSDGTLRLAGDMWVTGTGRFFLGSGEMELLDNGELVPAEYRLELGGYQDGFILWAGTGIKDASPDNYDWIFYVGNDGSAKFRGTVESQFISGAVNQIVVVQEWPNYTVLVNASGPSGAAIWPTDFTKVGEWYLPASPFNDANVDLHPGHVPYLQLQFFLYGEGQTAGTIAVEWDSGNGNWVLLKNSVYNIGAYGGAHQIMAVAPARIFSGCRFRLYVGPRANEKPTINDVSGIVMGIR